MTVPPGEVISEPPEPGLGGGAGGAGGAAGDVVGDAAGAPACGVAVTEGCVLGEAEFRSPSSAAAVALSGALLDASSPAGTPAIGDAARELALVPSSPSAIPLTARKHPAVAVTTPSNQAAATNEIRDRMR